MRVTTAVLATLCLAGPATLQAQGPAFDTLAVGRKASELFLAGSMDSLWTMLTPGFQEGLKSVEALNERLVFVLTQAGNETRVIEEAIKMRKGEPQYWRTSEFDTAPEPIMIRWVISPDGKVSGMGLNPASQAPPTDDQEG